MCCHHSSAVSAKKKKTGRERMRFDLRSLGGIRLGGAGEFTCGLSLIRLQPEGFEGIRRRTLGLRFTKIASTVPSATA